MELPAGHMSERDRDPEPVAGIRVLAVDGARIAYYRPSIRRPALRLGDRVTVVDPGHPSFGEGGDVAEFRPDQPTPVGVFLDADDDRTFIAWFSFEALALADSPIAAIVRGRVASAAAGQPVADPDAVTAVIPRIPADAVLGGVR